MKIAPWATVCVLLSTAPVLQAKADDAKRWQPKEGNVLQDTSSGLQWTQQDNAADIDWAAAKKYCDSLKLAGGGWRLPTAEELTAIYSVSGQEGSTTCGSYENEKPFNCNVTPLFKLSGPWFWTSAGAPPATADGAPRAVDVNLINGLQHPFAASNAEYGRALCVRRR